MAWNAVPPCTIAKWAARQYSGGERKAGDSIQGKVPRRSISGPLARAHNSPEPTAPPGGAGAGGAPGPLDGSLEREDATGNR